MDRTLEKLVLERAESHCEYCRLEQTDSPIPHEIDHIIAAKHGGETTAENLALSCSFCNRYKGPNVAGVDPITGLVTRLFHPRKDRWRAHFLWDGPRLTGLTRIGRTTIRVLAINRPELVAFREMMIRGRS
jgi:hypothetical protein